LLVVVAVLLAVLVQEVTESLLALLQVVIQQVH